MNYLMRIARLLRGFACLTLIVSLPAEAGIIRSIGR
jgi:hypothetical protein